MCKEACKERLGCVRIGFPFLTVPYTFFKEYKGNSLSIKRVGGVRMCGMIWDRGRIIFETFL